MRVILTTLHFLIVKKINKLYAHCEKKHTMKHNIHYIIIIILFSFGACRPSDPVPKPKGYFKIALPEEHKYQQFTKAGFPFSFAYPVYGKITQDTGLVLQENAPYWINVSFPDWDATVYLSYKPISQKEPIAKLINESYKLSYSHDIRADYIKTPAFKTQNGLTGIYYHVGGNAASAYQFYLTDSSHNFIRGALYFNVAPNSDSLMPATEFLRKDLEHLVESLEFN